MNGLIIIRVCQSQGQVSPCDGTSHHTQTVSKYARLILTRALAPLEEVCARCAARSVVFSGASVVRDLDLSSKSRFERQFIPPDRKNLATDGFSVFQDMQNCIDSIDRDRNI